MLRKLAATLIVVLTTSLAIAATAFARIAVEVGSGSSPAPTTTGGDGLPWGDIAIGAAVAAAVVACLAGFALTSRNRRRSAVLHA